MRKISKIITVGAIATSLLCNTMFAAVVFQDISKSWAKSNIERVVEKGLMKGTTKVVSGKTYNYFNPKSNISSYESLIVIARMMGSEKEDTAKLVAKFRPKGLEQYAIGKEWAWPELAFCMEKGIIGPYDLKAFQNKETIMKKDITLFLGKAFGVTEETGDKSRLPYKDKLLINESYVPHILFLLEQGILSVDPKVPTNFDGGTLMTREVFAKMIDGASDAYAKLHEKPTEPTEKIIEGHFVSATDTTITIGTTNATGEIKNDTYGVGNDVVCTVNGITAKPITILADDKVKLTFSENILVKIVATSNVDMTTGVFVSYEKAGVVEYVTIQFSNGQQVKYQVNFSNSTDVIKDNAPASVTSFKAGNRITKLIVDKNNVITFLQGETDIEKGTGEIRSIITETGKAPIVKIAILDSEEIKELVVLPTTKITVDGKVTDVYALRNGMQIKYMEESEVLMSIENVKTADVINFTGEILEKNTLNSTITVKTYNYSKKVEETKIIKYEKATIRSTKDFSSLTVLDLLVGDIVLLNVVEENSTLSAKNIMVLK